MGLFKNLTKALKKAAPVIGGTIGFGLGGPLGAANGSGIGGLAAGQDVEDALKTALIGGTLGYAGRAAGFAPAASGGFMPRFVGSEAAAGFGLTGAPVTSVPASASPGIFTQGAAGDTAAAAASDVASSSQGSGIMSALGNFASENKLLTAGLGLGALGLLGMTEEEEKQAERPFPKGEMFDITSRSRETGDVYQLTDPEDLAAYQREISNYNYMHGGEVHGPGTGTSDSVPARLSDGEFVVTAKAVRGAGGGDRDIGAARMYDMMAELEASA